MPSVKNKNVLVTGASGMIGRALVDSLIKKNARVIGTGIENNVKIPCEYIRADLTHKYECEYLFNRYYIDIVFHVAGIKGSPKMTKEKPASFMEPMLMFNTNMMHAAMLSNIEWYLYTSSVGVYHPCDIMNEKDVWKTFPSENDKFAGWTKRIGELQLEAHAIQSGHNKASIVRPFNVYGPYDNFDPDNAMVIPSLISRVVSGENPLKVWGDGSAIRDFIYCQDVAQGMITCVEKEITEPVNLASGQRVTIKDLVECIIQEIDDSVEIIWDTTKPSGDKQRVGSTVRANKYGIVPSTPLETGIKETVQWYKNNIKTALNRFNAFKETK